MDKKVISVTTYVLKPGVEDLLLPQIGSLVEVIRQVSGCLAFDLYRLIGSPETLALQETWESEEAYRGYSLSALQGQLASLFGHYVTRPAQAWQVEEISCWGTELE